MTHSTEASLALGSRRYSQLWMFLCGILIKTVLPSQWIGAPPDGPDAGPEVIASIVSYLVKPEAYFITGIQNQSFDDILY